MTNQTTVRRSVALAAMAIIAVVAAAYASSFAGVLLLDDGPAIPENPTLRHLWPLTTPLSPPRGTTLGGRPIANLSFAINHAVTGNAVWGYHAGNLLIHVLCALFLFGILRRTFSRSSDGNLRSNSLSVALSAAMLWGVHPLTTEAVTYVVQRVESLMALFVLAALYCFIRAIDSPRKFLWLCLSSGACLLGAGTKEVAAVTPLLIFLYDRLFVSDSIGAALKSKKGFYASLTLSWALLAVVSGWSRAGSAGFGEHVSAGAYWLTQSEAICRYLRLALWPSPLVFDYGTYLTPLSLGALPGALLLGALVAATVVALARHNRFGYAGVWYLLILAPTAFVPVATQTMAEHRAYLPTAAVVVCVILAIRRLAGWNWKAWTTVGLLVVIFATMTENRNSLYGSEVGLWAATARDWPQNPRAHCSLGEALTRQPGKNAMAVAEFREAIRLNQSYADAHLDLGVALAQDPGSLDESIQEFARALQINPDSADAHNDLGQVLGQKGQLSAAKLEFEEAVRIQPRFSLAECNLGILFLQAGQGKSAEQHLTRAMEIDPENARAEFFLAGALAQEGRIEDAKQKLQDVIHLKPSFADAHSTLGMLLFRSGNPREGMAEIDEAIRLQPGLVQAHLWRGAALMQEGLHSDAKMELQRVLELQPDNPAAMQMLQSLAGSR